MASSGAAARADGQPPGAAGGPAGQDHRRCWWILGVLAAVAFMAQLDLFVVNIAVPAMARSFGGAGLPDLSWVLNAYAIVFAALLVPARLADHFGRRRFLLVGVAVFTLASALCAAAPSVLLLVIARAIQAVGAALIVPTSLGLLLTAFGRRQHSMVVGIWAGVAAVAASSGPPVGGLLIGLSWRWIFLINLPTGLFVLLAGLKVLPEVRADRGARLPDALSVGAVLAAITLLVLATVEGPELGWSSPATIALFGVGAVAAAVTVQRTIVHPHALIEASLFRSREFTAAAIALFLFFIAFAAWLLIMVLFLQDVWHYSALRTGLAIAPGPLTAAVFAMNGGRIAALTGRTAQATAGCLFFAAAGAYFLSVTPAAPSYAAGFLPALILAGIGSGLAQAPMFTAASTLRDDRATTGGAMLNMSRQVGSAAGVALLVTLLGSPHPSTLAQFHRGWALQLCAAAAGGACLIALRSRRDSAAVAATGTAAP